MITDYSNRREKYEAHLKSELWQLQRKQAFERWGKFCTVCGNPGAIHVHHLNYRNLVDCVPEDFMPLCERCHKVVHETPELDRMARTPGEPMEKRRMVLLRLKEVKTVTTVVHTITIKEKPVKLTRRQKRHARLMAQQLIRDEARAEVARYRAERQNNRHNREVRQESAPRDEQGNSETTLKILSNRYKVPVETFAGWPATTINPIFHGNAFPLFARPALAKEIAATLPDATITLTAADVKALRTDKNAFTRFTTDALGLEWNKLQAGWVDRLVGATMPKAQYLRALAGAKIYSKAGRSLAI